MKTSTLSKEHKGKVVWFNKAKGYGEIVSDKNDLYFFSYDDIHCNSKKRSFMEIQAGTKVVFNPDVIETKKYAKEIIALEIL